MSHFCVVVIGPDHEGQLAAFDENAECPPYRSRVTKVKLSEMVKYFKKISKEGSDALYLPKDFHKVKLSEAVLDFPLMSTLWKEWSGAKLKKDSKGYYVMSTYNPQSKWDWYTVGGRWDGFFKNMDGSLSNQLPVGEVDFDAMVNEAVKEAEDEWHKFTSVVGDNPLPPRWKDLLGKHKGDSDAARAEYGSYESVKALRAADMNPWFEDVVDIYGVEKKEFLRRAASRVAVPYAIVHDGEWFARGEMGWWGMSRDEISEDEWGTKVYELYKSLTKDTLLTLVDCHI